MQTANAKSEEISLALANSQGALYAYIFLRLGDPDAVDDVLQETNRYIWRNIDHLDSPANFLPWARTLALFQVKRYLKTRGRERGRLIFDSEALDRMGEALPAPVPSEEPASAGDGTFAALRHCVGKLPPEKRRLLDRRYGDRDSVFKIAVEELKTPTAVSVALHRIREQLRDCIRNFACRMGEDAAPGTGEAVRARFFERVFDAAPGARPALARALKDDPSLLREWADQGDIHAQLLFYADRLRLAAPPAVSARSSLRRIAALVVVGLAIGLAVFATTVAAIEKIGNQKTETGMTVRAETEKQTPGTSTTIVTAEGRAGGPSRAAGVRSTLSSTSSSSASSTLTQENTAMNTNTLTNTIAAAASAVTLAAAVATPAAAPAAWTYYTSGESGNPTNVNCITDGNWVLGVRQSEYVTTNIYDVTYLSGGGPRLDLSTGVSGTSGTAYAITRLRYRGFADNTTLEEVVIPGKLDDSGSATFSGCTALRSARYVPAPLFREFSNSTFDKCPLTNDVADIIPPFCEKLPPNDWVSFDTARMCGSLVLTNLTSIRARFSNNLITNLLFVSDSLTTANNTSFNDCTQLSNIVLRLPKLLTFDLSFKNCPMTNDVACCVDPAITNMTPGCFTGCSNMVGCLVLTNLMMIGDANQGGSFSRCSSLQELRIGGPLASFTGTQSFLDCTSVTNIVLTAPNLTTLPQFDGCTNVISITLNTPAVTNVSESSSLMGWAGQPNLRDVTFGMTNAFTVESGNFIRSSLSNVVFQGAMPDTATMDNILHYVSGDTSTHACTIYASRSQAGWKDYCAAYPVSDAERTAGKVPADCMGVYVTAGGARKAWIVNYKSPQDGPGGFVIRICESDVAVPDLTSKNCQLTSNN